MTTTLTEAPTLTLEDVASKMLELAEANPEHVYERPDVPLRPYETRPVCRYVHDGSDHPLGGGCLVGQALVALGVPKDMIRGGGHGAAIGIMSRLGIGVENDYYEDVLEYAISDAQGAQDREAPWGEAIEPVRRALELVKEAGK